MARIASREKSSRLCYAWGAASRRAPGTERERPRITPVTCDRATSARGTRCGTDRPPVRIRPPDCHCSLLESALDIGNRAVFHSAGTFHHVGGGLAILGRRDGD